MSKDPRKEKAKKNADSGLSQKQALENIIPDVLRSTVRGCGGRAGYRAPVEEVGMNQVPRKKGCSGGWMLLLYVAERAECVTART